ncbi:hypothetical protein AVEN_45609-1, partial [Araneus ventricosus]
SPTASMGGERWWSIGVEIGGAWIRGKGTYTLSRRPFSPNIKKSLQRIRCIEPGMLAAKLNGASLARLTSVIDGMIRVFRFES